jgi:Ca-activated chloride channel homolog
VSFIWPALLLLLALIPAGAALYLAVGRRRRRRAARFGLEGQSQAKRQVGSLRRHLVPAFFLLGITITVIALARPQTVVSVPTAEGTIILAFDVSGSMAAADMTPTRMEAAKAAARDFVQRQPRSVVIGVVAFSDGGFSVQTPTNDQATVLAAINRLTPTRGTSLGQGILMSLDVVAAAEADPAAGYYTNRSPAPSATLAPVPPGTHRSAAIVVLTDGESNQSPDPLHAAQAAADRGVRINTVGIGSARGATLRINGFLVHTQLNEPLLEQISQITGGAYYNAQNQAQLQTIYDNLETRLVIKPQAQEVTSIFAGVGLLALVIGGLASLLSLGRIP